MSSCCKASSQSECQPVLCPSCGSQGQQVSIATVGAMARIEVEAPRLSDPSYGLCLNPACRVVYFGSKGSILEKSDVRVVVGFKEATSDAPVCYCFGHTWESILREISRTGRSTVGEQIAREVKAGRCACEVKNPSGACCLGEVGRVVRSCLDITLPKPASLV